MSSYSFRLVGAKPSILLVLAGALAAGSASAASRIVAPPTGIGGSGDAMGTVLALSGDTAAVGIPNGQTYALVGAIAVFHRDVDSWTREAFLVPQGLESSMFFGSSLALQEDLLVAPGISASDQTASLYTYVRSNGAWALGDQLPLPLYAGSNTGQGVALSGQTLLILGQGPAQVYARAGTSWAYQTQLSGDQSGEWIDSVALDGDVAALIGTVRYDMFTWHGYLHMYARAGDTWTLESTIDLGTWSPTSPLFPTVTVSGDTVLLGDWTTASTAKAYVRDQGAWSFQGVLDPGGPYTGTSVALSGDEAVIGAAGDDVAGATGAGDAYVFERSGGVWTRTAHLYDSAGESFFSFGDAVAIGGGTILSGSPRAYTAAGESGKVTVFELDGTSWDMSATLDDGNSHRAEWFGDSLAVSGSTLVVGAPFAVGSNPSSGFTNGAAYIFGQSAGGWNLVATFVSTTDNPGLLGAATAADGDTVVAGAPNDDDSVGAAYVYGRSGDSWAQVARLTSGNSDPYQFGASLALGGGWLAIGTPGLVANAPPPGVVHMYSGAGANWIDEGVLIPSVSSAGDEFGFSLALSGDTLLVGAPHADDGIETDSGAVFVFVNNGSGWTEQAYVEAPVVASGAGFGVSVALHGDVAAIGAGGDNASTSQYGAAYVFRRSGGLWTAEATLRPDVDTTGSYGHAVSISPDASVVSVGMSHTLNGSNFASGKVFTFAQSGGTWQPAATLEGDAPPESDDGFGSALASSEGLLFVGATQDAGTGAVYAFGIGNAIFASGFDPVP